jgi:dsRNA-specific ribonuclease
MNEGVLTRLRTLLGNNSQFSKVGHSLGWHWYVLIDKLQRPKVCGACYFFSFTFLCFILCFILYSFLFLLFNFLSQWIPNSLVMHEVISRKESTLKQHYLNILADVVEAMIGFVYLRGGMKAATSVSVEMKLVHPFTLPPAMPFQRSDNLRHNITKAEALITQLTKHKFADPFLLQGALTHPSTLHAVANYEKLEWIGDAVIELYVRTDLYLTFRQESEHYLSKLKDVMVCNETLGYLCHFHSLDAFIEYHDEGLLRAIGEYKESLQTKEELGDFDFQIEIPESSFYLWKTDPPKILSDVTESVIGAIYIDLNCDFHRCCPVIHPIFEKFWQRLFHSMENGVLFLQPKAHAYDVISKFGPPTRIRMEFDEDKRVMEVLFGGVVLFGVGLGLEICTTKVAENILWEYLAQFATHHPDLIKELFVKTKFVDETNDY